MTKVVIPGTMLPRIKVSQTYALLKPESLLKLTSYNSSGDYKSYVEALQADLGGVLNDYIHAQVNTTNLVEMHLRVKVYFGEILDAHAIDASMIAYLRERAYENLTLAQIDKFRNTLFVLDTDQDTVVVNWIAIIAFLEDALKISH